jgi:hypothetical protein
MPPIVGYTSCGFSTTHNHNTITSGPGNKEPTTIVNSTRTVPVYNKEMPLCGAQYGPIEKRQLRHNFWVPFLSFHHRRRRPRPAARCPPHPSRSVPCRGNSFHSTRTSHQLATTAPGVHHSLHCAPTPSFFIPPFPSLSLSLLSVRYTVVYPRPPGMPALRPPVRTNSPPEMDIPREQGPALPKG